jgi:hypothetical protein
MIRLLSRSRLRQRGSDADDIRLRRAVDFMRFHDLVADVDGDRLAVLIE